MSGTYTPYLMPCTTIPSILIGYFSAKKLRDASIWQRLKLGALKAEHEWEYALTLIMQKVGEVASKPSESQANALGEIMELIEVHRWGVPGKMQSTGCTDSSCPCRRKKVV